MRIIPRNAGQGGIFHQLYRKSHSNFELQLFKILSKIAMRGERRLTPWHFIRKKWELLINAVN